MSYINSEDSKPFMTDLKAIYQANTLEIAEENLVKLEEKWMDKYPISVRSWKNNWEELSTYFVYSHHLRKIIYTTNTIESYNRQLRKVTKNKSVFPNVTSLEKLLYLATKNIEDEVPLEGKNGINQSITGDKFFDNLMLFSQIK